MNILLIGFRYQEIEALQDILIPELPQLKIDFAVSVRDSCYRLKISAYDLIVLDATSSETGSFAIHQEVSLKSEGKPIILITTSGEIERLSHLNGRRPRYVLSKENNYIQKLASILKKEEDKPDQQELPGQLYVKDDLKFDRNLLEVMLNGLSDGLLFCNTENKIILLNHAAESILQIPKGKLIGKSIFELPLGEGTNWLIEVLNGTRTRMRFSSLAFNTQINDQDVQIRFAPIFIQEKFYLGGFLYLTEVEERLNVSEEQKLFLLNDKIFDTLHFTTPKIIAEG